MSAIRMFSRNQAMAALLGAAACLGGASVAGGQGVSQVPAAQPLGVTMHSSGFAADSVTGRPRVRSIEYSDWYARRLMIHRIGSYVMLPLFATEYYLGDKLINGEASSGERDAHVAVATAIGGLFAVNTVTGVWNLWDSRKDPSDRTKKLIHSALMLGADAGFALAAASAEDDYGEGERERGGGDDSNTHKTIALTSIGISTVGTALMWFWK
jgi:hypothetical protein